MKYLIILSTALLIVPAVSLAHESGAHEDSALALVKSVVPDGPAATAGVQADDFLMQLDGQEIKTLEDLQKIMALHSPGDRVPLIVERDKQPLDLTLTFGERSGGGVSLGVSLAIASLALEMSQEKAPDSASALPKVSRDECLAWVDRTYKIPDVIRNLGLDLSAAYKPVRACTEDNLRGMAATIPLGWCDNIFKIHCSGLDLLTELGEAQVEQCEELLADALGVRPDQYGNWKTCGRQKVFDRYSMTGETSDEDACGAAFLEECGTNIDKAIQTGAASSDQGDFEACCSAVNIDSANSECRMIDDGFERGPCLDQPICVNRLTSEWINCSIVQ